MAFPLASALSPSCLRGTCLLQATSLCSPSLVGFLRQGGGRRVCGDGYRPMPSSLIAGKAVLVPWLAAVKFSSWSDPVPVQQEVELSRKPAATVPSQVVVERAGG